MFNLDKLDPAKVLPEQEDSDDPRGERRKHPPAGKYIITPWDTDALKHWTVSNLITVRSAIDNKLPLRSLNDVNLEKELLIQFQLTQEVMNKALNEDDTSTAQRVQTLNSCQTALSNLARLQMEVYNSERLKKIERAVVDAMKQMPSDVQKEFFELYERLYGALSKTEDR